MPDLPRLALLGDVDAPLLARLSDAGLAVAGALAPDPLATAPDVRVGARYGGLDAVLRDRGLRGVVLPPSSPLAPALPALLAAGLGVLLPEPAPWDPDLVREARRAADEQDVPAAVLLAERHRGWAALVASGLSGRPAPRQVTVRGWPRGPAAAAELVDLVRAWCGDVLAVAAAPAELPAAALPDGAPVAWSLLTVRGTTVLVSHQGEGPEVRLSLPSCRLVARPEAVGWEGGQPVTPSEHADPTLPAFAAALRAGTAEPLDASASLADLVPVTRVLAALRASARTEAWTELA